MKKIFKLSKLPLWCVVLFGCGEVVGSESGDSAKMRKSLKNSEKNINEMSDEMAETRKVSKQTSLQSEQQTKKLAIMREQLEQAKADLAKAHSDYKTDLSEAMEAQRARLDSGDIHDAIAAKADIAALDKAKNELSKTIDALKVRLDSGEYS